MGDPVLSLGQPLRPHHPAAKTSRVAEKRTSPPPCERLPLYRARWHAELDLRSLKVTLGMDVLRGTTPRIVRKDIWAHLLSYNLIRSVMAQAAVQHGVLPRPLSLSGWGSPS